MTKTELFIQLSAPDQSGKSRWVYVSEFIGEYKVLQLGNGGSWCRASSSLSKRHIVEFNKDIPPPGNSIDAIRLNGINTNRHFNQNIRQDIKAFYGSEKCVMLGVSGFSENTKIEIDHKDGRKSEDRISNIATQRLDDFQPLCKAANDVKRQICKRCKETNKRWDAQNIAGNPYPFYKGDEDYSEELRRVGCYQYDPVKYRTESVRRITEEATKHTTDFIMNKLYPKQELSRAKQLLPYF